MQEQIRFDPLDHMDAGMGEAEAAKEAQRQRRIAKAQYHQEGYETRSWCLAGQLRKYKSFGVEDGRIRTVYYLTISK
jgi:muconolactone delta-isomerase